MRWYWRWEFALWTATRFVNRVSKVWFWVFIGRWITVLFKCFRQTGVVYCLTNLWERLCYCAKCGTWYSAKNILSELSVMYTIWRVRRTLPFMDVSEKRMTVAPSIFIPLLFTAWIVIVTGKRLCSFTPKRFTALMPTRQLWQPVSAMTFTNAF